jgi:thiol-disulfide isomerase/thioredoxin
MAAIKAIHVVHATWCPHCHPTTVEPLEKLASELGIALVSYDIDKPEDERRADELVRKFGDASEDYLIPQVFLEMEDGQGIGTQLILSHETRVVHLAPFLFPSSSIV